jgi:hypothetical protein
VRVCARGLDVRPSDMSRWLVSVLMLIGVVVPIMAQQAPYISAYAEVRESGRTRGVEIDPGTSLRTGDGVALEVSTDERAFVYVFAIGPSGSAILLHPFSRKPAKALVREGGTLRIPRNGLFLPLDRHVGRETLVAVSSRTPLRDLDNLLLAAEEIVAQGTGNLVRGLAEYGPAAVVSFNHIPGGTNTNAAAPEVVSTAVPPVAQGESIFGKDGQGSGVLSRSGSRIQALLAGEEVKPLGKLPDVAPGALATEGATGTVAGTSSDQGGAVAALFGSSSESTSTTKEAPSVTGTVQAPADSAASPHPKTDSASVLSTWSNLFVAAKTEEEESPSAGAKAQANDEVALTADSQTNQTAVSTVSEAPVVEASTNQDTQPVQSSSILADLFTRPSTDALQTDQKPKVTEPEPDPVAVEVVPVPRQAEDEAKGGGLFGALGSLFGGSSSESSDEETPAAVAAESKHDSVAAKTFAVLDPASELTKDPQVTQRAAVVDPVPAQPVEAQAVVVAPVAESTDTTSASTSSVVVDNTTTEVTPEASAPRAEATNTVSEQSSTVSRAIAITRESDTPKTPAADSPPREETSGGVLGSSGSLISRLLANADAKSETAERVETAPATAKPVLPEVQSTKMVAVEPSPTESTSATQPSAVSNSEKSIFGSLFSPEPTKPAVERAPEVVDSTPQPAELVVPQIESTPTQTADSGQSLLGALFSPEPTKPAVERAPEVVDSTPQPAQVAPPVVEATADPGKSIFGSLFTQNTASEPEVSPTPPVQDVEQVVPAPIVVQSEQVAQSVKSQPTDATTPSSDPSSQDNQGTFSRLLSLFTPSTSDEEEADSEAAKIVAQENEATSEDVTASVKATEVGTVTAVPQPEPEPEPALASAAKETNQGSGGGLVGRLGRFFSSSSDDTPVADATTTQSVPSVQVTGQAAQPKVAVRRSASAPNLEESLEPRPAVTRKLPRIGTAPAAAPARENDSVLGQSGSRIARLLGDEAPASTPESESSAQVTAAVSQVATPEAAPAPAEETPLALAAQDSSSSSELTRNVSQAASNSQAQPLPVESQASVTEAPTLTTTPEPEPESQPVTVRSVAQAPVVIPAPAATQVLTPAQAPAVQVTPAVTASIPSQPSITVKPEPELATLALTPSQAQIELDPNGDGSIPRSLVLIVTPRGVGSGVVVDDDGHVLTNWHSVNGFDRVVVWLKAPGSGTPDLSTPYSATLKRGNRSSDLALLQLDTLPEGLAPIPMAGPGLPNRGDAMYLVSHFGSSAWRYAPGRFVKYKKLHSWITGGRFVHKEGVLRTRVGSKPASPGGVLLNGRLEMVGLNAHVAKRSPDIYAVNLNSIRLFLSGDLASDPDGG